MHLRYRLQQRSDQKNAPTLTQCTLYIYHVVDCKFGGFFFFSLMDFLNFVPATDGDELIIICEDTGRVNRVPGFLSSRPNWLPPPRVHTCYGLSQCKLL